MTPRYDRVRSTQSFDPFMPNVEPAQIGRPDAPSPRTLALVAAIISQAIEDAQGRVTGVTYRATQRKIQAEAREWLMDLASIREWSVGFCCDFLQWDAATLVKRVENPIPTQRKRRGYTGRQLMLAVSGVRVRRSHHAERAA